MKKTYVNAKMEIIEFDCEDIITTSVGVNLPFVPNPQDLMYDENGSLID